MDICLEGDVFACLPCFVGMKKALNTRDVSEEVAVLGGLVVEVRKGGGHLWMEMQVCWENQWSPWQPHENEAPSRHVHQAHALPT